MQDTNEKTYLTPYNCLREKLNQRALHEIPGL